MRRTLLLIVVACVPMAGAHPAAGAPAVPRVPHVFLVFMENKDAHELVGNAHAPYINTLIRQYGFAAEYYGVTHPSLPNYVAAIAGDFFNAYNDWNGNRFSARNLVDQMTEHGLSWKAYMGGLPRAGYRGDEYPKGPLALYARKHNPFMMMRDILSQPSQRRKSVPEAQLTSDLKRGQLPSLAFISPNMCDDMHGINAAGSPCPDVESQLIATGDRHLSQLIPTIMKSPGWTGDSTIFIVWDEGNKSIAGCCDSPSGDGGGLVPALVIAREGVRHYRSSTPYNHYSLLKTLQTIWNLGCLANTCDDAHVKPMTEFLSPPSTRSQAGGSP